jgi:cbb3-type cytochrome oxidase cytochrome c subunit
MAAAIKQFRLAPRKVNPNYTYTFDNDANINRIARQLATLDEFGLSSREQIYAKAVELKSDNSDEAKAQLRRIRELIKVYEDIVEGNYIDNLIKSQAQSQNAAQKQSHKH